MFVLISYPVVALLMKLVSPLPQSDDGNSLDSAISAGEISPQQPNPPQGPLELSISSDNDDDDDQKVPVDGHVTSSIGNLQTDSNTLIPLTEDEMAPQNGQIANLGSDEPTNPMDYQTKDEETNEVSEISPCTENKGNIMRTLKRSNACPNPMSGSLQQTPDSDLSHKLPKILPVGDRTVVRPYHNFCPPGFSAFCCQGPIRQQLQQGDAVEDCADCRFIYLMSCLSSLCFALALFGKGGGGGVTKKSTPNSLEELDLTALCSCDQK